MGRLKDKLNPNREPYQEPQQEPETYDAYNSPQQQPMRVPIPPAPPTKLRQHLDEMQSDNKDDGSVDKIYENIVAQESKMPLGELYDIKRKPVPKGVCEEIIYGVPINWHDLENFVLKLSPTNFVTMLKLRDQDKADYDRRFKVRKSMMSGKIMMILLIAVGLGIAGIVIMLFLPDILAMLGG